MKENLLIKLIKAFKTKKKKKIFLAYYQLKKDSNFRWWLSVTINIR